MSFATTAAGSSTSPRNPAAPRPTGRGLGVVAADLDDDNSIDLYVANDGTANYLFRNLGNFHFEEIGLQAGVAGNAEGGYQAGMGVACGDLDGDGRPDLMVTNFYGEGATLYQNLGQGLFADRSAASGIGLATRYLLGFGIAMADVTNHGRLDVMITNGHVNDNRPYYRYAMPCRLYRKPARRAAGRRLEPGRASLGRAARRPRPGRRRPRQRRPHRCRDRRSERAPGLFPQPDSPGGPLRDVPARRDKIQPRRRRGSRHRHGGRPPPGRAADRRAAATCPPTTLGSTSDSAQSSRLEQIEVRWPSGRVDRHADLPADTGYLLREGDPKPQPLVGMTRRSHGAEPHRTP